MKKIEVLVKSIMLLMAEYKVGNETDSTHIVEQIVKIETSNKRNKTFTDEDLLVTKLLSMINSILNGNAKPNDDIMFNLEIMLSDKPSLIKIVDKYINGKNIKSVVSLLIKELNRYIKQYKARLVLQTALTRINKPNVDVDLILEEVYEGIDAIRVLKRMGVKGLVDEIDFESKESVDKAAKKAEELISGKGVYKLGWKCMNDMCQDGWRRGEFITVSALKHNYKSSFIKSALLQIIRLNEPINVKPGKKPLFLFISLEEEINNIMFFFYSYIKFNTEGKRITPKDKTNLDAKEISDYVYDFIKEKGFSIKVMRFVPELFTFNVLFDVVNKLESKGFDIHGVFLDYVKKMSRAGCNMGGPNGTDLLELFSRIRNEFSAKEIMFVTPHQLSTEAQALARSGLPPKEFIEHIKDKSYYADSKQLGQEIDLEIFLHKGKINKQWHLFIGRGKHRIPTTIEDKHLNTILKFTDPYAPIPEDKDEVTACVNDDLDDDEFNF